MTCTALVLDPSRPRYSSITYSSPTSFVAKVANWDICIFLFSLCDYQVLTLEYFVYFPGTSQVNMYPLKVMYIVLELYYWNWSQDICLLIDHLQCKRIDILPNGLVTNSLLTSIDASKFHYFKKYPCETLGFA